MSLSAISESYPAHIKEGSGERLSMFLLPVVVISMLASNSWVTALDDECAIIDRAAKPVHETIQLFFRGVGEHEHPPLYDLLLHGWLRLTGGNMHLLRVPAIIFYVLGGWTLARAAKHLGGTRSQMFVLWMVALWPYGFHFGRVATWYSFGFFLVSLVTLCYFRFLEVSTRLNWLWLVLASLALVYSNYFGWALLGCLALDFALQRKKQIAAWWLPFFGTGALLLAAYTPLFASFLGELRHGAHAEFHATSVAASAAYNLYCIFVSESVAPWFWLAGIIAGIAIASCLFLVWSACPLPARHFLLYFFALFGLMTVMSILFPKRIMLISPWLLLPIGVTLGTLPKQSTRRTIVALIVLVAGIGWFGIFSRNMYAAPHWVEPWSKVAQLSADVIHNGGVVIGNNPSFFFYMTYLLPPDASATDHGFAGLLPRAHRKGIYDPDQWAIAGRPLGPTTLLIKGLHFSIPSGPTDEAESWLDMHCRLQTDDHLVNDPGARWKNRFAPQTGQTEWRIEVRTYSCP